MDDILKCLQEAGKSEYDNLTKCFKETKDGKITKESKEKGRSLIDQIKDRNKVKLDKMAGIVNNIVENPKKSLEELTNKIAEEGPRVMDAVTAGVNAFKDTYSRKSKK